MGNLQGAMEDCTESIAIQKALEVPKYGKNRVLVLQMRGEALEKL